MRQYRERELTAEQEKIAGRRWPTRQIICLVDKIHLHDVLKRLAAMGQIDDIRALCISDEQKAKFTTDDKRKVWDLFVAVTYRELEASNSAIAAWEFAESWMKTTDGKKGKKITVAKLKHHDVDNPGTGVPPAVQLPFTSEEGQSAVPTRTRSLLFTTSGTTMPTMRPNVDRDIILDNMIQKMWKEIVQDIRYNFRAEIENQPEWVAAVNDEWTKVYDPGFFCDPEEPNVKTFESVEVARKILARFSKLKMSDERHVTATWVHDPALKDFELEDTVRELLDGEEDELNLEMRNPGNAEKEEESEEESEEE